MAPPVDAAFMNQPNVLAMMLRELLTAQPPSAKGQDRMMGGPTMPPSMPQYGPAFMPQSDHPKTSPSTMPPPNTTVVPKPPMGAPGGASMPPGFALQPGGPGAPGPLPMQPGGTMPPVPMPPPPGAAPMKLGPSTPPAPAMAPPGQAPSFRGQAMGLFGGPGGGKTIYDILADTMAGVAGTNPAAPPLSAFAGGFAGAAGAGKKRSDEATEKKKAAEKEAYEREGTDLDRASKRQTMALGAEEHGDKRSAARLARIKSLVDISKSLSGGDKDKFRQEIIKNAARGGLMPTPQEVEEAVNMAFPEGAKAPNAAGGAKPPPGATIRNPKTGQMLRWDDGQGAWLDEQGQPVDIPAM